MESCSPRQLRNARRATIDTDRFAENETSGNYIFYIAVIGDSVFPSAAHFREVELDWLIILSCRFAKVIAFPELAFIGTNFCTLIRALVARLPRSTYQVAGTCSSQLYV